MAYALYEKELGWYEGRSKKYCDMININSLQAAKIFNDKEEAERLRDKYNNYGGYSFVVKEVEIKTRQEIVLI